MMLDVAKSALEAVKRVIKQGLVSLHFVSRYGLQTLIDVRNCHFEIQLSTSDLSIFDVKCEVNAFKTGLITVAIKINFNDPIQSIWNAAKGTIELILNKIDNVLSDRKRRDLRDKSLTGLYTAMRFARSADAEDVNFEMFANQTLNVTFIAFPRSNTGQPDEYTYRKQMFADKCLLFTRIHLLFYNTTSTLLDLVHDTATKIQNITSLQVSLPTFNIHNMASNLSFATLGVDPNVAKDEFNISTSELNNAIDDARENFSTDPLLVNLVSFAEDASTFLDTAAEGANKIMIVHQWIAAINNVTIDYFDNDTCVSFLDCAHYAIAALYEQYMAVNITNQTEILDSVSQFEDTFLLLVGNGSHTIEAVDLMAISLVVTLQKMKQHYVFCSKAPEMLQPLQNLTLNKGSNVSLVCNATGDPTPNFWWYKDGQLILGENKMLLYILNAEGKDSAVYHCIAGNLVANYTFDAAYVNVLDTRDVVHTKEVIDRENGVDLKAVLIPIFLLLPCAVITGVLIWRHRNRILVTKTGHVMSFENSTYDTIGGSQSDIGLQDSIGKESNSLIGK
ncbi:uncharacterized protein LOC127843250 [Dreissena polymorpha]|nr:uncharacterized protein LOC127843250 [Dreissena polymorpha]